MAGAARNKEEKNNRRTDPFRIQVQPTQALLHPDDEGSF